MTERDFIPDTPADPKPPERNKADHTRAHSILVAAVRSALVSTGRVVLWPNPSGFDARAKRPYGIGEGGADTVGILIGPGRFFAVECKTGGAELEPHQVCWHRAVHQAGGFATVARTVEEALAALDRAFALKKNPADTWLVQPPHLWEHFQ